jgi:hypothetical protein
MEEDLDQATLEYIATALEQRHGNHVYCAAWKSFARSMRRNLMNEPKKELVAQPEKISSNSARPV